MKCQEILNSLIKGMKIDREYILQLLKIKNDSAEFYELLSVANGMSRSQYGNQGMVFAQIGINAEPCSKNCKFCSMGKDHYVLGGTWKKDVGTILKEVEALVEECVDDLFLMTTADYPIESYISMAREVRKFLPQNICFVANIGDFDYETALILRDVGFTGAYHICRLREGIDTTIGPEIRVKTLDAIKKAGLELYYCVEPIGPEHSYEELTDEILRARDYEVEVMAVMRRIPVPGTPLYNKGQISAIELTKIAAVTRIVTKPGRAMNAHEPTQMTLLAGVNQLYAEFGSNPRDIEQNTENNRGFSVAWAWKMLGEADYKTKAGTN